MPAPSLRWQSAHSACPPASTVCVGSCRPHGSSRGKTAPPWAKRIPPLAVQNPSAGSSGTAQMLVRRTRIAALPEPSPNQFRSIAYGMPPISRAAPVASPSRAGSSPLSVCPQCTVPRAANRTVLAAPRFVALCPTTLRPKTPRRPCGSMPFRPRATRSMPYLSAAEASYS